MRRLLVVVAVLASGAAGGLLIHNKGSRTRSIEQVIGFYDDLPTASANSATLARVKPNRLQPDYH